MSRQYYPSQTHVLPLNIIRRQRTLPWRGEVVAGTRQEVGPSDVVARAGRPKPPLIYDVATKLGMARDEAERCMKRRPGDPIAQGDVIAECKTGLWGTRRVVSPTDGRVLSVKAGRLIVEPEPDLYELRALISGVVVSITPGSGVIIETPGALVQGVWGSGKEGYGELQVGVDDPGAVMDPDQIDSSYHGTVLVCGATLTTELVERAQELQVRGLVVGAVPAKLQGYLSHQVVPVIATEGMGRIPISSAIFDLLQANLGRQAMLLAVLPARWQRPRPEIIIPLPASTPLELPPVAGTALAPGLRVRIRRGSLWGAVGTVQTVHDEPRSVASGIRFPGADIALDSGTVTFVPYVNLDLLEN